MIYFNNRLCPLFRCLLITSTLFDNIKVGQCGEARVPGQAISNDKARPSQEPLAMTPDPRYLKSHPITRSTDGDFSKLIKYPEGTDASRPVNGLGQTLPPGLSSEDLLTAFLTPDEFKRYEGDVSYVGAVEWRHVPGSYVAVICMNDPNERHRDDMAVGRDPRLFYYFGVFRLGEAGAKKGPVFVARSEPFRPSTHRKDWSLLEGGPYPDAQGKAYDDGLLRFDMAPYRVTKDDFAFGVRSALDLPYTGGYGHFETLHLFLVTGKTIRPILSQPLYYLEVSAGEWNPNGTRVHYVTEVKCVLVVENRISDRHFDLAITQLTGNRQMVRKVWEKESQSYKTRRDAQK
jgi:hypothetical protein